MIDPFARTLAAGDLALEPMTAQTNALATGRDLRLVESGGMLRTAFRVGVELLL